MVGFCNVLVTRARNNSYNLNIYHINIIILLEIPSNFENLMRLYECIQTCPFQEYSFYKGDETLGKRDLEMVYNNVEHKINGIS